MEKFLYAEIGPGELGHVRVIIGPEVLHHDLGGLRSARVFGQHALQKFAHSVAHEVGVGLRSMGWIAGLFQRVIGCGREVGDCVEKCPVKVENNNHGSGV